MLREKSLLASIGGNSCGSKPSSLVRVRPLIATRDNSSRISGVRIDAASSGCRNMMIRMQMNTAAIQSDSNDRHGDGSERLWGSSSTQSSVATHPCNTHQSIQKQTRQRKEHTCSHTRTSSPIISADSAAILSRSVVLASLAAGGPTHLHNTECGCQRLSSDQIKQSNKRHAHNMQSIEERYLAQHVRRHASDPRRGTGNFGEDKNAPGSASATKQG